MKFKKIEFNKIAKGYWSVDLPFCVQLEIRDVQKKGCVKYVWTLDIAYRACRKGLCSTLDRAMSNAISAYHEYVLDSLKAIEDIN